MGLEESVHRQCQLVQEYLKYLSGRAISIIKGMKNLKLKSIAWKSTVVPPEDANRPRCKVMYCYDGVTGVPAEDDTDYIDWLIVIAYETKDN